MRILITGGAGYIGSHVAVATLAAGHDVHVVDSFVNASPVALERVRPSPGAPSRRRGPTCATGRRWRRWSTASPRRSPSTSPG